MAKVFYWHPLSENVVIFRLKSAVGETFPEYKAGQNIELYSEGTSTIFSIASAPHETKKKGYLEFFVSRDNAFREGDVVEYADHATGDFTLDRTKGFENVIFVATGTGVAPFRSMIRELNNSQKSGIRYTLIHGSRNKVELGYHKELSAIAIAGKLDLLYIPTISRPSVVDWNETSIGKGRAGSLLRRILSLPYKGEAVLPDPVVRSDIRIRFHQRTTIILACGSHASVADIKNAAVEKHIQFEKEDW